MATDMTDAPAYDFLTTLPDAEDHMRLRREAGMSRFSAEATRMALKGTIHGVTVVHADETVGMGRIIGDGGCLFQIVDIVVAVDHRGRGLGKRIMQMLMDFAHDDLPSGSYISLIADVPANLLYEQFGFRETAPVSLGMAITTGAERQAASPLNPGPTE
ncbi:MAG: GNAT family N-acetyltransferase [Pseudomonadota bacterium]